ncbi:hypothetical protein GQ55_3G105400 [Panicum hallii var. hallii]|uniref:Uncharacterized protein n=1 Tax=Panicum hallii var. hallii TaxID=1504633 RepID=A0A2T7E7Y2_9POAL|nr:hypothetical protein GQ55_3G105400 [Panicum hallii var. hallii]
MGRPSGRKRAAVLGFLGFTAPAETMTGRDDEQGASSWQRSQQHQQAATAAPWTRAPPPPESSGGGGGDDIDRRAAEFIDRVHRGMLLAGARGGDDAAPRPQW